MQKNELKMSISTPEENNREQILDEQDAVFSYQDLEQATVDELRNVIEATKNEHRKRKDEIIDVLGRQVQELFTKDLDEKEFRDQVFLLVHDTQIQNTLGAYNIQLTPHELAQRLQNATCTLLTNQQKRRLQKIMVPEVFRNIIQSLRIRHGNETGPLYKSFAERTNLIAILGTLLFTTNQSLQPKDQRNEEQLGEMYIVMVDRLNNIDTVERDRVLSIPDLTRKEALSKFSQEYISNLINNDQHIHSAKLEHFFDMTTTLHHEVMTHPWWKVNPKYSEEVDNFKFMYEKLQNILHLIDSQNLNLNLQGQELMDFYSVYIAIHTVFLDENDMSNRYFLDIKADTDVFKHITENEKIFNGVNFLILDDDVLEEVDVQVADSFHNLKFLTEVIVDSKHFFWKNKFASLDLSKEDISKISQYLLQKHVQGEILTTHQDESTYSRLQDIKDNKLEDVELESFTAVFDLLEEKNVSIEDIFEIGTKLIIQFAPGAHEHNEEHYNLLQKLFASGMPLKEILDLLKKNIDNAITNKNISKLLQEYMKQPKNLTIDIHQINNFYTEGESRKSNKLYDILLGAGYPIEDVVKIFKLIWKDERVQDIFNLVQNHLREHRQTNEINREYLVYMTCEVLHNARYSVEDIIPLVFAEGSIYSFESHYTSINLNISTSDTFKKFIPDIENIDDGDGSGEHDEGFIGIKQLLQGQHRKYYGEILEFTQFAGSESDAGLREMIKDIDISDYHKIGLMHTKTQSIKKVLVIVQPTYTQSDLLGEMTKYGLSSKEILVYAKKFEGKTFVSFLRYLLGASGLPQFRSIIHDLKNADYDKDKIIGYYTDLKLGHSGETNLYARIKKNIVQVPELIKDLTNDQSGEYTLGDVLSVWMEELDLEQILLIFGFSYLKKLPKDYYRELYVFLLSKKHETSAIVEHLYEIMNTNMDSFYEICSDMSSKEDYVMLTEAFRYIGSKRDFDPHELRFLKPLVHTQIPKERIIPAMIASGEYGINEIIILLGPIGYSNSLRDIIKILKKYYMFVEISDALIRTSYNKKQVTALVSDIFRREEMSRKGN